MPKLKLDTEALQVQSFDTSAVEQERGTVFANDSTQCISYDSCNETCQDMGCQVSGGWTCNGSTCAHSCYGTCYNGCGGTQQTDGCSCL